MEKESPKKETQHGKQPAARTQHSRSKKHAADSSKQGIEPIISVPQPPPTHLIDIPAGQPKRIPKLRLITGGAVTLLLLWTACSFFLSSVTVGTAHLHDDVSNARLSAQVSAQAAAYRLSVAPQKGPTETFSLQAIPARVNLDATIHNIHRTEYSPMHMLLWWKPAKASLAITMSSTALQQFITAHLVTTTHTAQNAGIKIVQGVPQITPGVPGAAYAVPNAKTTVVQAVEQLQTTPLRFTVVSLKPAVTAAALASVKTQLNAILNQRITLTVGNQTLTPSASDVANWITITPTATTAALGVDSSAIAQYLQSVADSHSQPSRSQVVLASTGEVLSSGERGVVVGSTDAATTVISQALLHGNGIQTSLPVAYSNFGVVRAPTEGKWIEVNVATKRMYTYNQGQLVRSFLISAGASATPTVTGSFAIYAKYLSQNMYGENVDGSNYFQPHVPYVNYFYQDYAIHGNYWRPNSYFGNINSSHGCVGLTVSDSAWVYNWAPIGTPVIVHT